MLGDAENLKQGLYLMNQVYELVVLIVLGDVVIYLSQDIKISFNPWILILEDSTFLALFQYSANECNNILHLFRSESFN